jgi:hypothetical protein
MTTISSQGIEIIKETHLESRISRLIRLIRQQELNLLSTKVTDRVHRGFQFKADSHLCSSSLLKKTIKTYLLGLSSMQQVGHLFLRQIDPDVSLYSF